MIGRSCKPIKFQFTPPHNKTDLLFWASSPHCPANNQLGSNFFVCIIIMSSVCINPLGRSGLKRLFQLCPKTVAQVSLQSFHIDCILAQMPLKAPLSIVPEACYCLYEGASFGDCDTSRLERWRSAYVAVPVFTTEASCAHPWRDCKEVPVPNHKTLYSSWHTT